MRTGLPTGEWEILDEDIVGLAVHAALVATGNVLVSRTVRDLVVGLPATVISPALVCAKRTRGSGSGGLPV
jgi:hypothetical protein